MAKQTPEIQSQLIKQITNLEKLAAEGERLLMKEMERRYLHLRKKTEIFNDYREKGQENIRLQPETMLMFGPIGIPNIKTPKSEYYEALEDYKLWAKHIEGFGLSVGWCSINIKSYEEALK